MADLENTAIERLRFASDMGLKDYEAWFTADWDKQRKRVRG